jgi:hypothetical protein
VWRSGTVGAPLALAEDPALLARVEALAVLLQALGLAALAPAPDLRQLQPQVEHSRDLLHVLGEGPWVASERLEDGLLVGLVLVHVAAAHAVAVLRAEDLQVEALAVHLEALRLAAVAPQFLHLPDLAQPLPLLRTAPHLPPLPLPLLATAIAPRGLRTQPQRGVAHGVVAGGDGGYGGVAGGQFSAGTGGV